MRTFRDDAGREWRVWQVVPDHHCSLERRRAERRRQAHAPPTAQERRTGVERRGAGSVSLNQGWLCFDAAGERRRLFPAPPGWESSAEEKLRLFLRAAWPARRT